MTKEQRNQALLEKRKLCEVYKRNSGALSTGWERLNLVGIIYRIVNLVNGKSYIGQTMYWFNHRYRSGRWWIRTDNILLERAAIKYGIENFVVEILEYNIPSIKELNILEIRYIAQYKTFVNDGNGYNLDRGGNNKSSLGRRHSQETKEKMSNSQKGNKNHMFGKNVSIESRIKMSKAGKGKKQSPEHIRKRTSARKKPVIQYDLNTGEMIRLWPSATDAGKNLSIKRSDITANCKNRQKSAHNFRWSYA